MFGFKKKTFVEKVMSNAKKDYKTGKNGTLASCIMTAFVPKKGKTDG